jgi:hypothetical protein
MAGSWRGRALMSGPLACVVRRDGTPCVLRLWQVQRAAAVVLDVKFPKATEPLVRTDGGGEGLEAAAGVLEVRGRDLAALVAAMELLKELLCDVGDGGLADRDIDRLVRFPSPQEFEVGSLGKPVRPGVLLRAALSEVADAPVDSLAPASPAWRLHQLGFHVRTLLLIGDPFRAAHGNPEVGARQAGFLSEQKKSCC